MAPYHCLCVAGVGLQAKGTAMRHQYTNQARVHCAVLGCPSQHTPLQSKQGTATVLTQKSKGENVMKKRTVCDEPAANLTSASALPVACSNLQKRFGATIIATLLTPILFFSSRSMTLLKSTSRRYTEGKH